MTFIMKHWQRLLLGAFLVLVGGAAIALSGSGSANADTGDHPVPPQFALPTLPTAADLQTQATAWISQKQTELDTARKEIDKAVAPFVQPAPAAVPAAAPPVPAEPVLISPEIDRAIVSALPASLPEITQQVVDPVFEAGLSTILGAPASLPEVERMDPSTPLATQVAATVDLFAVKDITPNQAACGGESLEDKTACAAAIVADNTPGDQPVAKVNLVSRYGVEAWITPWGSLCGGFYSSMQYCGEIYASKAMFAALAADKRDPTLGEMVLILGHEEQHNQDALSFDGGPGAFFGYTGESDANVYKHERRADIGGMYVVQSAVNKGQLSPAAVEEGLAQLSRIGFGTDEDPEPTHGSANQRVEAGKEGVAAANQAAPQQEDYALAA